MKLVMRMILVAAMAVATLSTASAQRQGGGGGGGFVPSAYGVVGTSEDLQKELKISDEQKTKLKDAMEPINKKRMELFTRGQGGQQTDEQRKERAEKMTKLAEETKAAVGTVLNAEQTKRLGQIDYQMMGIAAYSNAEVQKKMSFTDDQKDKVKATVEAYQKDRAELMKDAPRRTPGQQPSEDDQKKSADLRRKGVALSKEAEDKIVESLTADQKKTWTDMIGEKVDVSKFMQFGGPRRPMTN